MTKLNQIVALVSGKKTRAQKLITESHQGWNKDAISGISKSYTPRKEDGEVLAPETKNVQLNVTSRIREISAQLADFINIVATQETGNTFAKANVSVDNQTVLSQVPITVLLFLERQAEDLRTFIQNLPVLPSDRTWRWDGNRNCYVTDTVTSVRTQKQPRVLIKYEATKEHPAQTEVFTEDVPLGTYSTIYLSSAIPEQTRACMLSRIEKLQDALKIAREEANASEVSNVEIGQKFLDYVFSPVLSGAQS